MDFFAPAARLLHRQPGKPMTPKLGRPARTSHEMRVLVAESDAISRDNLCDRISSWGFAAKTVEDTQLLDVVRTFQPDVLLMDLPGQEKRWQELRARGDEIPTVVMARAGRPRCPNSNDQLRRLRFSCQARQFGSSGSSAQ